MGRENPAFWPLGMFAKNIEPPSRCQPMLPLIFQLTIFGSGKCCFQSRSQSCARTNSQQCRDQHSAKPRQFAVIEAPHLTKQPPDTAESCDLQTETSDRESIENSVS